MVEEPLCKACSVRNLSWIALLDKFKGDLDEFVVSVVDECTPSGWDSGGSNGAVVVGVGDDWFADIEDDVTDDNDDDIKSLLVDPEVTSLETGLKMLPSLDVLARMVAAAAAAAAAATFVVWDALSEKTLFVEIPLVIVTVDPVGDGIDL